MSTKTLTMMRQEYVQQIVDATNACRLPAVFKADVLEDALRQLRVIAERDLKRETEAYNQQAETTPTETVED